MYICVDALISYLERRNWALKKDTERYWLYSKKDEHRFECDALIPKNHSFADYNTIMETTFASIADVEGVRAKDIERYAGWMDYADEHICMLRQLENYMDAILQAFGYKDTLDFVELEQPSAADFAMYVCEYHNGGILMSEKQALELIQKLTAADIKAIPHI